MIRVRWELEEAVALMNLYFRYGATLGVPNDELNLSESCQYLGAECGR